MFKHSYTIHPKNRIPGCLSDLCQAYVTDSNASSHVTLALPSILPSHHQSPNLEPLRQKHDTNKYDSCHILFTPNVKYHISNKEPNKHNLSTWEWYQQSSSCSSQSSVSSQTPATHNLHSLIIHIVPPVGVWAVAGCGADLLINICLTILGYGISLP